MENILGKDLQLFIGENGKEKAIACATSLSLQIEADTIDISCKDTGDWGASMPGKLTWSISTDALITLDADGKLAAGGTDKKAYTDMMDAMIARKSLHVIFSTLGNKPNATPDADGHVVPTGGWQDDADGYEGYGVITSIEATADNGDLATYSIDIQGVGALAKHSTKAITGAGA